MINSKKSREELLKELYELKIENESLKAAFKEDIAGRNSIINDIANKEYIKKALESEKQRLSVILKGTNAGTWEWNIQTGETIFNERWAEILGYSLEEISPVNIDTWIKFVHPEDLKISNDLLNLHFIGELDYYECEARMKHKSGNWVWVMDRGRVHSWDIEGKPLLMSGTHQDITSRKNAEVALQKSQYLYTLITDNISDVIWMMDLDGKFIYISQRF